MFWLVRHCVVGWTIVWGSPKAKNVCFARGFIWVRSSPGRLYRLCVFCNLGVCMESDVVKGLIGTLSLYL